MDQVPPRRSPRGLVLVVAVALMAHVWMLNPGLHLPGLHESDTVPSAGIVLTAPAPPLPTTGHCTVGTAACLVPDPDHRPAAVTLAVLTIVGTALWTLAHLGTADRPRPRTRHERCPPPPRVPSSVVLLQ